MGARFDGGRIVTDAGGLLLREEEKRTGILDRFARLFSDGREPARIEHSCLELLSQRIDALALGYEDLNDHGSGADRQWGLSIMRYDAS